LKASVREAAAKIVNSPPSGVAVGVLAAATAVVVAPPAADVTTGVDVDVLDLDSSSLPQASARALIVITRTDMRRAVIDGSPDRTC